MTAMAGRPFIVIGENIHATRVVLLGGSRVAAKLAISCRSTPSSRSIRAAR